MVLIEKLKIGSILESSHIKIEKGCGAINEIDETVNSYLKALIMAVLC